MVQPMWEKFDKIPDEEDPRDISNIRQSEYFKKIIHETAYKSENSGDKMATVIEFVNRSMELMESLNICVRSRPADYLRVGEFLAESYVTHNKISPSDIPDVIRCIVSNTMREHVDISGITDDDVRVKIRGEAIYKETISNANVARVLAELHPNANDIEKITRIHTVLSTEYPDLSEEDLCYRTALLTSA